MAVGIDVVVAEDEAVVPVPAVEGVEGGFAAPLGKNVGTRAFPGDDFGEMLPAASNAVIVYAYVPGVKEDELMSRYVVDAVVPTWLS
jgi:hypothetical protein